MSFPGRYSPGLIEAKFNLRMASAFSSFRGVIAPASLKLRLVDDGIIGGNPFRGVIAPASLKLEPTNNNEKFWQAFRGVIAPASLKH